jgi:uncharacterized protein (DUF4415 family)
VEFHDSARKHGVAEKDILHTIDHALAIEDAGEDIGPDTTGNLLEVVVMTTVEGTQDDVEKLAAEAETGYDAETLIARRNKRGRPTLGTAPASVESVRLDPELRRELLERARSEGTTTSELIREALRRYLHAA